MIDELAAAIEETLPDDQGRLARTAKALSLAFTSERAAREADYMSNPNKLDAYVASFLLPGAVKVIHCLGQADALGLLPKRDRISILDLGAGPGTASLAASLYCSHTRPGIEVEIAAIDMERSALAKAHVLFKGVAPSNHSLESAVLDLEGKGIDKFLKEHKFDAILAANLLNEYSESRAFELCRELLEGHLSEDGALIIIDSALRETARPLMALRDRLVAEGTAQIAAPCLHQKACPMLAANERDWCHFYIEWERPEYLVKLDEAAGMDHRHLKMSYFILKHTDHELRITDHDLWRVVSSPLDSKGKREVVLCRASGELKRVRRLTKDVSDTNRDFDSVKRGDVVRCDPTDRIHREDEFQILNSFL